MFSLHNVLAGLILWVPFAAFCWAMAYMPPSGNDANDFTIAALAAFVATLLMAGAAECITLLIDRRR